MASGNELCPADPAHGEVLPPKDGKSRFYCPHVAHDGRASSHPLGADKPTRAYFTRGEVAARRLAETPEETRE